VRGHRSCLRKHNSKRRAGELLKATERAQGKRTDLVPKENQVENIPTLSELGITKKGSSNAQFLSELPKEEFGNAGVTD